MERRKLEIKASNSYGKQFEYIKGDRRCIDCRGEIENFKGDETIYLWKCQKYLKKKEQKTEQKVQTKKSKAEKGKSKTDAKQSKKNNGEKAEDGNKDEATTESKAENEVRTDDANHEDNQKEKAPARLPESIEVIDEPRKFLPETPEEQEAYKNIVQGKMRAAKDNETVEDAVSDWGAVQKIEGVSKKDKTHKKDRHNDEKIR